MQNSTSNAANLLDQAPAAARETVRGWVAQRGLPGYRTDQIVRRLWVAPIGSWKDATELPAALRTELDQEFPLARLPLDTVQQSSDGTRKFLWRLTDGEAVESVLIPSGSRRTLCISSQAGLRPQMRVLRHRPDGLRRNLAPFEIAGQVRSKCSWQTPTEAYQHGVHGHG